jgi:protocatechuate 3,4-dioxygenase beta subunit
LRTRLLVLAAVVALLAIGALLLLAGRRPTASPPAAAASGASRASPAGARGSEPRALPPPQGELSIRGEVRGPAGPIAGAIVTATTTAGDDVLSELPCQCGNECGRKLLECGCGEAAGQLMELVRERRGEAPPVARATTDAGGRFVLEGLADGAFAVWAESRAGAGVVQGVRGGTDGLLVGISGGVDIAGSVSGEGGKGIAGALVTAIYARHSRFFEVLTAADGSFSLGPLPEGPYTVVASAAGLLPERERVTGSRAGVRLELAAPRAIAGTVLSGGQAAAGATVALHGEHKRAEARSDAEGRFAFQGLRPGEYELRASEGAGVAQESVEVPKGKDVAGVRLALRSGVELEGVVVDDAGAPVAGARVTADQIAPVPHGDVGATRTDPSGRFRLGPLDSGELVLRAKRDGFLLDEAVHVTALANASARIVLRRAQRIAGTVVDPEGKPVADVRIAARPNRGREARRREEASAHSGEAGTFTLDVAGGEYELVAAHEDFKEATVAVRSPDRGVTIRLDRGASLEGDVLDEEGAPVAGAEVSIIPASRSDPKRSWKGTTTTRGGKFRIAGLDPGPVRVLARKPRIGEGEFFQSVQGDATAEIPATGTARVSIRFDRGLSIGGAVVGPDGAPVPNARVRAWSTPRRPRSLETTFDEVSHGQGTTDRGGRFTVSGLKPGEHLLAVQKDGFDAPQEETRAQAGDAGVRIALSRTGYVRGRVVGDGGAPLARFRVNGALVDGSDGKLAVPIREDGSLGVHVSAPDYAPTERTVEVTRGTDVELGDVVLSRGREVRGMVVDAATGAPVAAARLRSLSRRPTGSAESGRLVVETREHGVVLSGADGGFALPNCTAGMTVRVEREGYAPATVTIGSDQAPVVVRLGRGATVEARVLNARGEPMGGLGIVAMARGEDPQVEMGNTDAQGRAAITGLSGGTFLVWVEHADNNPGLASRTLEVRDGETVKLEFREQEGGTTLTVAVSGPGVSEDEELHVGLLPGDVPAITRMQDFFTVGVPLQPGSDDPPLAPTFQRLAPGRYTVLVAKQAGNKGFRLFKQAVDVGAGPRQRVEVTVPAELPIVPM